MKTKKTKPRAAPARRRRVPLWQLRLYVMDQTPKSVAALANLHVCPNDLLVNVGRTNKLNGDRADLRDGGRRRLLRLGGGWALGQDTIATRHQPKKRNK